MKKIILLLTTSISSVCSADTFKCISTDGNITELSLSKKRLHWFESHSSAGSRSKFLGIDDTEFGGTIGYYIYDLIDFYRSEDSHFLLKLQPTYQSKGNLRVVLVFNCDNVETIENFDCFQSTR